MNLEDNVAYHSVSSEIAQPCTGETDSEVEEIYDEVHTMERSRADTSGEPLYENTFSITSQLLEYSYN